MGTVEEANVYLENGFYLALTGFLCKVKSDTDKYCEKVFDQLSPHRINPKIP